MLLLSHIEASTSIYDIIRLLCGILFIIVIVGVMYYMSKRVKGMGKQSKYMKIIDCLPLSQEKALLIIEVGGSYYLLSSTRERLGLIKKLSKNEIDCILNIDDVDNEKYGESQSFKDIFLSNLSKNISKRLGGGGEK